MKVTNKASDKSPMADFDHPMEMLAACHQRIEAQCMTLWRLADYLPQHGADAEAQQAASNVMRYFDSAGRHHREDEELDLFPAMLRAAKGETSERVALLIARASHEHAEIEQAWLTLREALERIAHGGDTLLDIGQVHRLCSLYRSHIAVEEGHIFPLARSLLGSATLADLGRTMARRRGVKL